MTKVTDSLDADRGELLRICSALSDEAWNSGSGCAGWTVKDVVSHLAALYWIVVDRERLPDVTGVPTEQAQDILVAERRSLSPAEVIADYESVSASALPLLASLGELDFEVPLGDLGTYRAREVPAAYSFDHYVHLRMDLFPPRGPLAGDPPSSSAERLDSALDWIEVALAQQNAAVIPELPGVVRFEISGTGGRTFELGAGDQAGRVAMDAEPFIRAVTQRADWSAARIDATDPRLSPALLARLKVF
jgi:uncharacterized protein (TIGR03083 family)